MLKYYEFLLHRLKPIYINDINIPCLLPSIEACNYVHFSIHPFTHQSPIHPFNHHSPFPPSIHPSTYPLILYISIHPFTHQSPIHPFITKCFHSPFPPSIHPSTYPLIFIDHTSKLLLVILDNVSQ